MFKLLFGLFLITVTTAQYPEIGSCPKNVPILKDFNVNAYLGLWYEQERYEQIFELNGDCVTAEYTLQPDDTVKVVNSLINLQTGKSQSAIGMAKLSYPDQVPIPGSLNVSFGFEMNIPNYQIVDTDYTTYSLVWNCIQLGKIMKLESLWVLAREEHLQLYPEKLQNLLRDYATPAKLRKTVQGEKCRIKNV